MTRLILDRTPALPYVAPTLDEDQLRVVNHRHGAMRVLAGPGTGKTTTLVAALWWLQWQLGCLVPMHFIQIKFWV